MKVICDCQGELRVYRTVGLRQFRECSGCGVRKIYILVEERVVGEGLQDMLTGRGVSAGKAGELCRKYDHEYLRWYCRNLNELITLNPKPVASPAGFLVWCIETDASRRQAAAAVEEPAPEAAPKEDIYEEIKNLLKLQMSERTFNANIRNSWLVEKANGHITIGVRDKSSHEWLNHQLRATVERAARQVCQEEGLVVFFEVEGDNPKQHCPQCKSAHPHCNQCCEQCTNKCSAMQMCKILINRGGVDYARERVFNASR